MAPAVEPFPNDIDRSLLHLFVFGADVGEAIAVALPDRGWILVDGCRLEVGGEEVFPALEAYSELRGGTDDPVELLLWTHPHADHYQGIIEAIDRHLPKRVGMTLMESPPPGSASREIEALGSHPTLPADLRLQDVFKQVKATVERVFLYWQERPSACLPLCAQSSEFALGQTRVRAFSPDPEALRAFYSLGIDGLRNAIKKRANEFSIVLSLEFGDTRVVLGGDLPYRSPDGDVLPHGWQWVEASAPQLAAHAGFKVSHHGSAEAIPPGFVANCEPREWLVTPFARKHLPRTDDKGGLKQLLRGAAAVRLTSSVGLIEPSSPGEQVPRERLRDLLEEVNASGFRKGLRRPTATGPFDFVWGAAFDAGGAVRRLFAGPQAITVVEAASS